MENCFYINPIRIDNRPQARELLKNLGVWKNGVEIMADKSRHFAVKVGPLSSQAAQILKEEMLSKGGEAAVHGDVLKGRQDTSAIIFGTMAQYGRLLAKLELQPFGLAQLAGELSQALDNFERGEETRIIRCGGKELVIGRRTLVMGILNVTPDSFSDGGRYLDPQAAAERALEIESQGADILDIGAESTRPGFVRISSDEEIGRLLPVLNTIADKIKIPVSVDTYKARTARAVLDNGADIINDVSGSGDAGMNAAVAECKAPFILMHCERETTEDVMDGLLFTLRKKKSQALEAGIREENIILDPGIGFGKTAMENLQVINRLDALKSLGSPILIGTSRKSVIGKVLNVPPMERIHGTSATVAASILRGAHIIRVHDVKEMCQVARMTDAILGREVSNG